MHAELLAKNGASGQAMPAEESLNFVIGSAASAGKVVDGLTEYALALAIDPSRFQPAPLDIVVRAAMAKLAAEIRESEAEITYDELPTVSGDWDRLQLLFEYLLDRALRHRSPERLAIHISAEEASGAWQFTVSDNAIAMDEDSLQKVFLPFARLHGNQRPGPGLVVCKAIVEKHGGAMRAEACPTGCKFVFSLPG
jgi:light-regulated signal transduction histidine kinase (bacteriophytochrome)